MSELDDPALHAALTLEFAILAGELDEGIEEMEHDLAAERYNQGAYPELGDEACHDRVHDDADRRAARINGGGPRSQVARLAAGCRDAAALRGLLEDLLDRAPGT